MVTDVTDLLNDDDENDTPTITKLRRALKNVTKERDTSLNEITTFKTQARESSLDAWLNEAKIDKGVKGYVPSDVDSPAALAAWLSDEGKLFARLKTDAPDDPPAQTQAPAFEDTETARLLGQMQASEASAQSATQGTDLTGYLKKLEEIAETATDEQSMLALLAQVPVPDGLPST